MWAQDDMVDNGESKVNLDHQNSQRMQGKNSIDSVDKRRSHGSFTNIGVGIGGDAANDNGLVSNVNIESGSHDVRQVDSNVEPYIQSDGDVENAQGETDEGEPDKENEGDITGEDL